MSTDPIARQCRVTGRVQGVAYRVSTAHRAQSLGLAGWCRNENDGSVTVVAQGPLGDVEQLIEWLHHGPGPASVTAVTVREIPLDDRLTNFEIR